MAIPGPCVMAIAGDGDLPSVLRVPDAAMQKRLEPRQIPASLDARLPQTFRTHRGPRLGRIARHDVLDGGRVARPSRSVALPPHQSFLCQPLAETSSPFLLGAAITASARRRSVTIRCGPSMLAHPRSRVACTTSERMECQASIGTSHGLCHPCSQKTRSQLSIDLQKRNWKFEAGFHEHTSVSL